MYDVVIIGGSAAGLNAALVLGRFRRSVLVCDTNLPRNAVATAAHGFLTQDGTPPSEILRIGREQLRPYESVELRTSEIVELRAITDGFELVARDGTVYLARRVLLATGIRDTLPSVDGLATYWGKGVYHCPYCHGWEVREQPIVAIGTAEVVVHLGMLLHALSNQVAVCVYEGPALTDEQEEKLKRKGIVSYHGAIQRVEGSEEGVTGIRLENGELIPCHAIFTRTELSQHSTLAEQIGCAMDGNGRVTVDMLGRTSVQGVYAAGDMTAWMQQLIVAAASGATAAAGINTDIAFS